MNNFNILRLIEHRLQSEKILNYLVVVILFLSAVNFANLFFNKDKLNCIPESFILITAGLLYFFICNILFAFWRLIPILQLKQNIKNGQHKNFKLMNNKILNNNSLKEFILLLWILCLIAGILVVLRGIYQFEIQAVKRVQLDIFVMFVGINLLCLSYCIYLSKALFESFCDQLSINYNEKGNYYLGKIFFLVGIILFCIGGGYFVAHISDLWNIGSFLLLLLIPVNALAWSIFLVGYSYIIDNEQTRKNRE